MTQNTLSEEQQRKNDVSIQHYNNIHFWLKYHYGKPTRCEDKKCTGGYKRMEYALKKGKKYEKVGNYGVAFVTFYLKADLAFPPFNRAVFLQFVQVFRVSSFGFRRV